MNPHNDHLFPAITDFRVPKKQPSMNKIIALLFVGAARLTANDDMTLLRAIAMVESADSTHPEGNDAAIGPCGGRGRFQVTADTWARYSSEPHTEAHKQLKSTVVALKILRDNRAILEANPRIRKGNVTTHQLACAWLCGPNYSAYTETDKQLCRRLEYAARVLELVRELTQHTEARTKASSLK